MSTVHIGSSRSVGNGNTSTHKRNDNGAVVWDADHGGIVYGIAVGQQGQVATGGALVGSTTTRYYNADGVLQWSANHGGQVNSVAIDAAGNIYTAGAVVSNVALRKYSPTGVADPAWDIDVNFKTMRAIHCGADGNIYVAGYYDASLGFNCAMYQPDGNIVWARNLNISTRINAIATDAAGNIYTGGEQSSALVTTVKTNSAGTQLWAKNHGAIVYAIAVDASGNVYTGGASYLGQNVRKYDSAGNLLWSASHGAAVYGIAVDDAGNVYTTGEPSSTGSYTTRKYSATGTLIWSIAVSATSWCLALGVDPPVIMPGLPIPLALGVPSAVAFHTLPGLPIPLTLGVPSVAAMPLPPLGDGVAVYRLYLSSGAALMELPLHSLQCRRRLNDSTWLVVVSPHPSAAALAALRTLPCDIIIQYGLRLPDGNETSGQMLRARVTRWDSEETPDNPALRLTGRVINVLEPIQTRAIAAIVSKQREGQRWEWTTAVINPRLRPGDTVTDGTESFIVHSVSYEISTETALMMLREASDG